MSARGSMRVASAPCSFGVDEVMVGDAWMPEPDEMLDWMAGLDYVGTELGPPGYLGTGVEVRERLAARGLELVGSFLPIRFSHDEHQAEDRRWLRETLVHLRAATPVGSRPLAILCDGITEDVRHRFSGRIPEHPEAWLPADRFESLIDNLHRAAEICLEAGFEVVVHPHAGTFIETADEIARVVERMDPSLLGLCLDTGHFRFGGADPVRCIRDYREVLRHVHVKDCRASVIEDVRRDDQGLEEALVRGVFTALGEGDSDIDGVIRTLESIAYSGWIVVEQDQFLGSDDTRESVVEGQRRNRRYLARLGI